MRGDIRHPVDSTPNQSLERTGGRPTRPFANVTGRRPLKLSAVGR